MAQSIEKCGSNYLLKQQQKNNPEIKQQRKAVETHVKKVLSDKVSKKIKEVITIPVVFHILHKNSNERLSEARVKSQLDVLNEDFRMMNANAGETLDIFKDRAADMEIEFCLAQESPDGLPTSGIEYYKTEVDSAFVIAGNQIKSPDLGGVAAWNADEYLNFWVGDLEPGLLGYAQFPGMGASTDGVAVDYAYVGRVGTPSYILGRTATHEVGHWMNLRHIWGDTPPDATNAESCEMDDGVDDTPQSAQSHTGCNLSANTCSGDDEPDMVQNFMDYSNDDCLTLFTKGQKEIARAVFEPGGPREAIVNSTKCTAPVLADNDARLIEITNIKNNQNFCTSTISPSIQFRNYGNNALTRVTIETLVNNELVDTYSWTGDVATAGFAETALNEINLPQGQNELKIVITGFNATSDDKPGDNEIILNIQSLGRTIPYSEDFEDTDFPPAFSNIADVDNDGESFELKQGVAYAGDNCMYINCFEYGLSGAIDELILPLIDLTNVGDPMLTFYNAYARYDSSDSDTLEILASKDCGKTYQSVYKQQGVFIATVGDRQEAFEPNSESQWRQRMVSLKAYEGESEVSIKFRCINSHEQNLYIDEIEISGDTTIPVDEKILETLQVYPNPVAEFLYIENSYKPIQKIWIKSIDGKVYIKKTNSKSIDLTHLSPGIYFLEAEIDDNRYSKKIIKL